MAYGWHSWVKRAALRQGASGGHESNPKLNAPQTCADFLEAWSNAGHDAYQMDRELGLGVNWAA
eukprot:1361714-Pyramimonas_sp.AAC.1